MDPVMKFWMFYANFPPLILLLISLPQVIPQDHIEVSSVVGNTGILPCTVDDIGTQQGDITDEEIKVIWRDPYSSMLTINQQTVTDDDRISVNRPYVKEWNLHIENIKKSDQGTYTCIINSSPQKQKSVTLWVWYPPTITEMSHDREIEVRPGDDIILSCKASGFPEPKINWFKYNYNGDKEELLIDSSTLRFSNISRDDGGDYECVADNGVSPTDKHSMKLDVKFPPEVKLPYQQITQHPGKDTLLECMISANPLVTHHWERNGVIVKKSDKYSINEWDVGEYSRTLSLHVKELKGEDFGGYTCVAANQFGTVVENMYVYAYQAGQIRVLDYPRDVISHGGQTVHFNCSIEGVSATNSLTWWHHHPTKGYTKIFESHPTARSSASSHHGSAMGGSIDSRTKHEIKGFYNLYVNNIAMQDSGEYICQISGHRNYSASLTFVEPPTCDSSGSVDAMRQATVSCSLAFSGPRPTWEVTWQHGDRKLSGINSDVSGRLERKLNFIAFSKDSGVYTCSISSQDPPYSGECSANLYVKGSGDGSALPTCAEQEGSYDNTLLLAILGAGICGLIILFLCILVAVVVNFKRQIKKYHERHPSNGPPTEPTEDTRSITHIPESGPFNSNNTQAQSPCYPDIVRDGDLPPYTTEFNTTVSTIMPYATTIGFINQEQDPCQPNGITIDMGRCNLNNNDVPYDKLFQPLKSQSGPYPGGNQNLNGGELWDQQSVHLYQQLSPEYSNGPRSVRYKNGNVSVETEGLTLGRDGGLPEEVEV